MAELVDALGSGPSGCKTVEVRVLSWAPLNKVSGLYKNMLVPAQVAELVDALGSGPSGGNTVEVRVLSWAPHTSLLHYSQVNKV